MQKRPTKIGYRVTEKSYLKEGRWGGVAATRNFKIAVTFFLEEIEEKKTAYEMKLLISAISMIFFRFF